MINEEGLAAVLARHARLAAALRAGFEALGFAMFPTGRPFSNTVTVGAEARGLHRQGIEPQLLSMRGLIIAHRRN